VLLFVIPLLSAVVYATSAIFFKRALQLGVGPWRTCFVSNILMGIAFFPLWFLPADREVSWILWQPVLSGLLFFLGQFFNFLAIDRGDVSIATPVLGIKVFLVAVFTTFLLGETIPFSWWVASVLTFIAVWILRGNNAIDRRRILPVLLFAGLGSVSYALADIAVQRFATGGQGRFLATMFAVNASLSITLIPFFRGGLLSMPISTWNWLLPGAALFAAAAIGVSWVIAVSGNATVVNVIYSARGVFSVLLIWRAGHWFRNTENQIGHAAMFKRLSAAFLIILSIALVMLSPQPGHS